MLGLGSGYRLIFLFCVLHCLMLWKGTTQSFITPATPRADCESLQNSENMSKTFMYFAYGSNLLTKRLHIQNPSAVKRGSGKLKNFKLDFNHYSKRWRGAAATIIPVEGSHVWGAIYEINSEHQQTLDNQEGVHNNIYFPLEVEVTTPEGQKNICRVYQQCDNPPPCADLRDLPEDRKPSAVYLNTIRQGAVESKLPEDYIKFLNDIPDNGYQGEVDVKLKLTE